MMKKINFLLLSIILLGFFLRFYQLRNLAMFVGDQGRDYLTARDILINRKLIFTGPQTSIPWVYLGPFFYYFLAFFLALGSYNPLWPAMGTAFCGAMTIYFIFLLGRQLIDQKTGLIAAFFYAISPFAIIQSRIALHPSIYPLFVVLFLLALDNILRTKNRNIFWGFVLVISFLISFQLHLSAILLLPITLLSWESSGRKLTFLGINKIFQKMFLASVLMLTVLKLIKGSPFTPLSYWWKIFGEIFSFSYWPGSILALGIVSWGLISLGKETKFRSRFYFISLLVVILGLTIKNSQAEHYFNLFLPLIILGFAVALHQFEQVKQGTFVVPAILSFYLVVNVYQIINSHYFAAIYGPGLSQRINLAKFIVDDAGGKKFVLGRRGPLWDFPSTNNNYDYLIWWLGGKFQKENQFGAKESPDYLIIEPKGSRDGVYNPSELKGEMFDFKFAEVIKNE